MKVHIDRQSRGIREDITSITFRISQPPQFDTPELNQGSSLGSVENVRHVEKAFTALGHVKQNILQITNGCTVTVTDILHNLTSIK